MNRSTYTGIDSTVLGATGLGRRALAAYYREFGLFGPDSSLDTAERAVLQARLGTATGTRATPPGAPASRRLQVLDRYARGDDAISLDDLRHAGFSAAALAEINRTVRNVAAVFGIALRGSRPQAAGRRPAVWVTRRFRPTTARPWWPETR